MIKIFFGKNLPNFSRFDFRFESETDTKVVVKLTAYIYAQNKVITNIHHFTLIYVHSLSRKSSVRQLL